MRLVVFNWQDRLHPQSGGAETHAHEIFSRFVRWGHDVTLVSCHFPGAARTEVVDGIRIVRIGSRSTYNFSAARWWREHGARAEFELVIDDINKIPLMMPLFSQVPVMGLIHHLFGSSIFREAGIVAGSYVWLAERLIPRVYRRTPIVVVSESTRQECVDAGLPPQNLRVITNGMDPSAFPLSIGQKTNVPTIAYFGRLKKYKSVDHVIRAFRIVKDHVPEARLEIIGRGDDQPRLEQLSASMGLREAITYHGFVDDQTKVRLLSSCHVVINPSSKEGWGITNIEANACGTPVISADSPGLRDSIKNDVSGILYPYGNIEVLSNEIIRVLTDDALRLRLSQGAVSWAQSFSWDDSARAMEVACQEVVSGTFGR